MVAEFDLVFRSEEDLLAHYLQNVAPATQKLAVSQRLPTGYEPVYRGSDALNIVYCVSDTLPNKAAVLDDMATATGDWEAAANIRFRHDPSQDHNCGADTETVDFAVTPTTEAAHGRAGCGANKLVWAEQGGCDGEFGVLQINYDNLYNFPGVTGAGMLRHELGHILGFRHEHPWAENPGICDEPVTSPERDLTARRLTGYDQASVMHYSICGGIAGSDMILSPLDWAGAIAVYGIPAAWYAALL